MSAVELDKKQEPLADCEIKLIVWLRRQAERYPYGTLECKMTAEFHEGKTVKLAVRSPAEIEERFR